MPYYATAQVIDTSGGCGGAYEAVIVSPAFEGQKLLARHRCACYPSPLAFAAPNTPRYSDQAAHAGLPPPCLLRKGSSVTARVGDIRRLYACNIGCHFSATSPRL